MRTKRRLVFFLLALLAVVSAQIYAHPGRTDGSGGHTNHSTGEYHYHHGYSEHQHYDMDEDGIADCPYDFKDNTSHKDTTAAKEGLGYWERKLIELEEEEARESTADYWDQRLDELGEEAKRKVAEEQKQKAEDEENESKVTLKNVIGMFLAVIIVFPPVIAPITYIYDKIRERTQKRR